MDHSKRYYRLLLLLPLALGTFGFLLARVPLLDALFQSVTMYFVNYSDAPPNWLTELARWLAPLATASSVLLLARSLHRRVRARWQYLRGESVAVYGPERMQQMLLDQLGARGVAGGETFVPAHRYILLGDEAESFAFYRAHSDALQRRTVYLRCDTLPAQSVAPANLRLFCPEEMAARLYWHERDADALWQSCGGTMQVVLLGFGRLGEALLTQGLLSCIFDPAQRVEYHVFGDCAAYLATHTSLEEISDPVIVHDAPWYDARALIEGAALVIVLEQEEQLQLLQALLSTTLRPEIDVFSAGSAAMDFLSQRGRLRVFDWQTRSMELPLLMEDLLDLRARRINLRYAHLYSGVPETTEAMEAEWEKLSAFTRGSNISAADYHVLRLKQLERAGLPADAAQLRAEELERLSVLEHIRWCRYHWMNNWRYGVPEDGRVKDEARRIHTLLVPYDTLSEAEKEKDRENIRVLLSIK